MMVVNVFGQFKPNVIVNGISYKAKVMSNEHATYIQQSDFQNTLAADSFYVDVMTEESWNHFQLTIQNEFEGKLNNDIYTLNDGRQIFKSEDRDKYSGNLLIITLFGSEE